MAFDRIKTHEILFLLAGLGILFSFPYLAGGGFYFWIAAKLSYFLGIVFFLLDLVFNIKSEND